ncbi:hypothetical protein DOY81_011690 [Sarcophaga bullata]|nr:hypothetical protein DOY81_011690 [Sarcophaga bullata]
MDFTSDTYKIFLQCNEIPLRQILNDFCDKLDDIVERILKDRELCDALNYYYYWKYLTNSNFASKYPVKFRNSEEHTHLSKENSTDVAKQREEKNVSRHTNVIKETLIEDGKTKESENDKELQENVNTSTVAKSQDSSEKQIENTNQNNKTLEKAKRIFFRNVERVNTLSYVVRTSFGLKQLILRSILSISYEEFLQLTNIYEGQSLYKDNHISECMYRYVFRTPNVWPTNLFITLQNLCDFLQKKKIQFNKHSTMLADVSPKLLHWSDLRTCTNIENSVKIDYEKRTGKKLNFNDATIVNNEFNEYYNRCWKQEKWLGQLPLVYIEFYTNYICNSESADVTMFDECATEEPVQTTTNICSTQECLLQEVVEEPVQSPTNVCPSQERTLQETTEEPVQSPTNICPSQECASQKTAEQPVQSTKDICPYQAKADMSASHQEPIEQSEASTQNVNYPEEIVPDCISEVEVETNNAVNSSSNANQSIKEFNCVLLPNTQQQISMLPAEVGVTNDPLNNCSMNINSLNVSASSSGNCEVITLSEQSPCIKTEPIDKKLLNNLLFYEDDDNNIQCVPYEEEIVRLDDTVSQIYCDLLPSQLEFDDVLPQQMLSVI